MDYWNAFHDRCYVWLNTIVYRTRWGDITNFRLAVVFWGLMCVWYHYLEMGWQGIIYGAFGYVFIAMVIFWFILGTRDD